MNPNAMPDADALPALLREAVSSPYPPKETAPSPARVSEEKAPRLRRLPADERHVRRGDEARKALDESAPAAAADERILHELVAKQLPIALMLYELEEQLAVRLGLVLDDPKLALAVTKIMRDTATMASAMSKRIQSTLATAASLRAQRRFLVLHGHASEAQK